MKVYISGPMSGIKDLNFPAFNTAAAIWRAGNHSVLNPAEKSSETSDPDKDVKAGSNDWIMYLKDDIKALVDCDAIAVLPGWIKSKGAKLEVHIATELSMPVYDAMTLELI